MVENSLLRLSAQRAFLGRITHGMRLITVKYNDNTIVITCYVTENSELIINSLISEASAEIMSDFPELNLEENIVKGDIPLPIEDILINGWIYRRYEPCD